MWSYHPATHTITLEGRLSVVTFLHEFGHARGYGERGACRFSINPFRRVFPRLFARCRRVGHTLVRGGEPAAAMSPAVANALRQLGLPPAPLPGADRVSARRRRPESPDDFGAGA